MTKDKITEYDATASNNTDVGGVNLAENSALPSDMNNAIREVLSHQKEAFGSGTPLYVDQTNNRVGIGTSSPDAPITIQPTAQGVGTNAVQNWMYSLSSGSEFDLKLNQIVSSGLVKHSFTLRNNGTSYSDNLVLDRGNVGIGTSPSDILHIKDTSSTNVIIDAPTDNATLTLQCGSSDSGAEGAFVNFIQNTTSKWQLGLNTDNAFRLYNYNTSSEALRIDSSGNLLVNTTSSTGFRMDLNANGGAGLFTQNIGAGTIGVLTRPSGNHNYNAMRFDNSSASIVGTISVNGSSTAFNTTSDHRVKENVEDMTGAIDRVKQLSPKRFNFIADETNTLVDGFLAHEAQSVVAEAVTGTHNEVDDDDNPVMQGIDQAKLVPLLTGALKEAIAKIENLEARITTLEGA